MLPAPAAIPWQVLQALGYRTKAPGMLPGESPASRRIRMEGPSLSQARPSSGSFGKEGGSTRSRGKFLPSSKKPGTNSKELRVRPWNPYPSSLDVFSNTEPFPKAEAGESSGLSEDMKARKGICQRWLPRSVLGNCFVNRRFINERLLSTTHAPGAHQGRADARRVPDGLWARGPLPLAGGKGGMKSPFLVSHRDLLRTSQTAPTPKRHRQ